MKTLKGKHRIKKYLVHAVAQCKVCDFYSDDYKKAQKLAREHFQKTGHRVVLDLGYVAEYGKCEN